MELGGPLGQVKYFSKLPGPGAYSNLSRRDMRAPSLRSRLPDHSLDYALKVVWSIPRTQVQEHTN